MDSKDFLLSNFDVEDAAEAILRLDTDTDLSRQLMALRLREPDLYKRKCAIFADAIAAHRDLLSTKTGFILGLMVCPNSVVSSPAAIDHIEALSYIEFRDAFGLWGGEEALARLINCPEVVDGFRLLSPRTIARIDRLCLARPVAFLKTIIDKHLLSFVERAPEDNELLHYALLATRYGRADQKLAEILRAKWPALALISRVPAQSSDVPLGRPRVAVCVSGQLRGYEEAFSSWKECLLPHIDATFYVSVWSEIGRKEPTPEHLDRVYTGKFLDAVRSVSVRMGWADFIAQYEPLVRPRGSNAAGREHLSELYGCPLDNILIEDDDSPQFSQLPNIGKMFYKIQSAHNLARGSNADLVIRIRPDKKINALITEQGWKDILRRTYQDNEVMLQYGYRYEPWGEVGGLVVDDQFAVARPGLMDHYVSAAALYWSLSDLGIDEWPAIWGGHINLSCTGWLRQISFATAPIELGGLLDPAPLSNNDLAKLLEASVSRRQPISEDQVLRDALQ